MAAVSDALRASIDGRTPAEWATIRAEAARDRNYVHPVERRVRTARVCEEAAPLGEKE
jgi:hypothetical protein